MHFNWFHYYYCWLYILLFFCFRFSLSFNSIQQLVRNGNQHHQKARRPLSHTELDRLVNRCAYGRLWVLAMAVVSWIANHRRQCDEAEQRPRPEQVERRPCRQVVGAEAVVGLAGEGNKLACEAVECRRTTGSVHPPCIVVARGRGEVTSLWRFSKAINVGENRTRPVSDYVEIGRRAEKKKKVSFALPDPADIFI